MIVLVCEKKGDEYQPNYQHKIVFRDREHRVDGPTNNLKFIDPNYTFADRDFDFYFQGVRFEYHEYTIQEENEETIFLKDII